MELFLGVFLARGVSSVLSSVDPLSAVFLDRRLGVAGTGGGGIRLASLSSSPLTVPSWLLGISVIPLLVRFVLARAASSLRDLGTTS